MARKTPKAGPTERKKALEVGTKVRVLVTPLNAIRATNRAIKHIRVSISVVFYQY